MQRRAMAFVAVLMLAISLPGMAADPSSAPVSDPAQDVPPAATATVPATSLDSQAPAPETIVGVSETSAQSLNIVKTIYEAVRHELRHSQYPWVDGLVALAFGLFLVIDGSPLFRIAITFAIFMLVALLAKGAVHEYWETNNSPHWTHKQYVADFVGLEVGIVAAMAAHKGYKGVLVCVGAAIGFACASKIDGFLVNRLGATFLDKPEVLTAWFTLWMVPLSIMFHNEKHLKLLAIVAPICGGVLVSSAIVFGYTFLFIKFACHDETCPGGLKPNGGNWVDFFLMLLNSYQDATHKHDVGVFQNSKYTFKISTKTVGLDRIIGLVLWFILAAFGVHRQLKMINKRPGGSAGAAQAPPPQASTNEVKAREPLLEGLLHDSA